MESLRGIFPRSEPPPKRDFLKENVIRIKNMQRIRKPNTEYSNKYSNKQQQQLKPRKLSLSENRNQMHRSNQSLALCSTKAPINQLRKAISTMSMEHSKEFGTQTVDPENDEYFLKDTIIRYPSASTIRSITTNSHSQPQMQSHLHQTCSRGHLMEPEESRTRHKSNNFSERRDAHTEKRDRHLTNLSEFLEKGSISKKPASILKSSSSLQKLSKNSLNEYQKKEDRTRIGSAHRARVETVVLSDDEDENDTDVVTERENKTELESSQRKETGSELSETKKQQLKAAAEDPDCPEGHVPLSEDERQESLKLAKKRKKMDFFLFFN